MCARVCVCVCFAWRALIHSFSNVSKNLFFSRLNTPMRDACVSRGLELLSNIYSYRPNGSEWQRAAAHSPFHWSTFCLCEHELVSTHSACGCYDILDFPKKFVRLIFRFRLSKLFSVVGAMGAVYPHRRHIIEQLSVKHNFTWSYLMAISNVKSVRTPCVSSSFAPLVSDGCWSKRMIMNSIDANALKIRNKFNSKVCQCQVAEVLSQLVFCICVGIGVDD